MYALRVEGQYFVFDRQRFYGFIKACNEYDYTLVFDFKDALDVFLKKDHSFILTNYSSFLYLICIEYLNSLIS